MYGALDELAMSGTQWDYTPDNDHAHGDQWNHEDLSVYCAEDGGAHRCRVQPAVPPPQPGAAATHAVRAESARFELCSTCRRSPGDRPKWSSLLSTTQTA